MKKQKIESLSKEKLNQLIKIEITIKALKEIIKTKNLKATLWTDDGAVESSELLIKSSDLQKTAKKKLQKLELVKKNILKLYSKPQINNISSFLKEDIGIKNSSKLYL